MVTCLPAGAGMNGGGQRATPTATEVLPMRWAPGEHLKQSSKMKGVAMSRNDYQTIGSVVLTGILAATLAILNAACSRAAPIPAVHSDIPVVHSERALPAEVLAKPLVVYNRPYTEAIYADYVPCAREVTAPFEMAMARNEYEPVQIGIYVPSFAKPLHDIRLEIECDIPFQTGYIYYQPREELPGNITNMLRDTDKPWEGKRDDIPLYIIPRNTITMLEAGRSGAFWVTFKTDATVPSGRHLGTAKVIASRKIIWELPLAVTIYSFELPRPTATFGFYYNPPQTPAKFQGLGFQRMYLADMAAHGMNTMNITLPYTTLAQPVQKECDEDLFMTPHISNPNDPVLGPLGVDPSSTSPLYVSNYYGARHI